jgi:hypothetical protein
LDTLLKKLRYAGQERVLVANVPPELESLTVALAAGGSTVDRAPAGAYPWAIVFVRSLAETAALASQADRLIEGDGVLWVAYPKQSSKKYSADVNRDTAWPLFDGPIVRFVAQVALDDDWSAMRVRRTEYSGGRVR